MKELGEKKGRYREKRPMRMHGEGSEILNQ